jgi:hypothetical protein
MTASGALIDVAVLPFEGGALISVEAEFAQRIDISFPGEGPFPESNITVDRTVATARTDWPSGWSIEPTRGVNFKEPPPSGRGKEYNLTACNSWGDPQLYVEVPAETVGSVSRGWLTTSLPTIRVSGHPEDEPIQTRILLCPDQDYVLDSHDVSPEQVATGRWLWDTRVGTENDGRFAPGDVRAHSLAADGNTTVASVYAGAFLGLAGGLLLLALQGWRGNVDVPSAPVAPGTAPPGFPKSPASGNQPDSRGRSRRVAYAAGVSLAAISLVRRLWR